MKSSFAIFFFSFLFGINLIQDVECFATDDFEENDYGVG